MISSGITPPLRGLLLTLSALAFFLAALILLTGCQSRRVRPTPSLAKAQAIAREQHSAFTAQQRALDAMAAPHAAARSHSQEAALRARQIDAKAQVILGHWQ